MIDQVVNHDSDVAIPCRLCKDGTCITTLYRAAALTVKKCRRCGLVFLDDAADEASLVKLYGEDYFQTRARYFFGNRVADPEAGTDNDNLAEFDEGLRALRQLLPQRGRLLDVGCGVGIFARMAQDDNWQVTGIDVSTYASRYAREHFGLDVRQGTVQSVALDSASFDAVTMWDLVEHVPDPVGELVSVARVLKRGGYLLVNTPNEAGALKMLAGIGYHMSLGAFCYPVNKLYHHYHLTYFTAATLSSALERSGLRSVTVRQNSIPIVKARGSSWEKAIVWGLSWFERLLGREYQLLIIAQKPNGADQKPHSAVRE